MNLASIDWFSVNGVLFIGLFFALVALGLLSFLTNLLQCIGRPTSPGDWTKTFLVSIAIVALLIPTLVLEHLVCDQKSAIPFLYTLALVAWSLNTLILIVTWYRHFRKQTEGS